MARAKKVLVLWNFVGEDVYEMLKAQGPQPLAWKPDQLASQVETVAEEIHAIGAMLKELGYRVKSVNIEDDFDRLLGAIRAYEPDVIFNLVEWFNNDQAHEPYVAGLYELLRVPYTGNTPMCLATCQRKFRTKVLLEAAGLPTPAYFLVEQNDQPPREHGIPYPLIVKPAREDASGGIEKESVVADPEALATRVAHVHREFQQPALVERYIEGREIHVAILGNDPPEVLPLLEFEFDDPTPQEGGEWRPHIVSYEAKWDPTSKDFYSVDSVVPPRGLPRSVARRIREVALEAYKVLGCRDYARVDLRVDSDGLPYILEVNPNPDLSDGTGFMLCAEKSGRTFRGTLGEIVEMALRRGAVTHGPTKVRASGRAARRSQVRSRGGAKGVKR